MFNLLLLSYRNRFLSKWTVLFLDLSLTFLALIVSIISRFHFSVDQAQQIENLLSYIGVLVLYA